MEGEDRKQFICRYCDKKFPCGKSLGGHLRSHTIARAVKDRTGIENVIRPKPNLSPPNHDAASESAAYVLRENPKKTWRFAGSRGGGGGGAPPHQLERFCKECGKGFQSMKALCGHMACHSDKDKVATMTMMSSKFTAEEKDALDSQSDTETTSGPRRGKRSKRLRYKTLDFNSNSSMSQSVANGSSSVSEIEQEQEEVALCLMMLSRDYSYGKGFNSFAESSDNNSVVLEAKSSSIDMKKNKNGFGFAATSDSGYEAKIVKSEVFADGFERDCGFNRLKGKNKFEFESFERVSNKQLKVNHCPIYGRSTRIKDHELWEICHKKIENGTASIKTRDKNGFNINGCCDSICESGENSIEADSFRNTKAKVNKSLSIKVSKKPVDQDLSSKGKKRLGTKKSKGHKCPICFRVFKSGQALGGHKRSHFLGGSDGRTVVVLAKQQVGLLDLNLPAPDEEEDSIRGHAGFMGR